MASGGVGFFASGYFHENYFHVDYWLEQAIYTGSPISDTEIVTLTDIRTLLSITPLNSLTSITPINTVHRIVNGVVSNVV